MAGTAAPPDHSMFDELRWVHDMLRRDLATCRELAEAVRDGAPADVVRDELDRLTSRGGLFQLKTNCLRYCQIVHLHHGLEDAQLFPTVRRAAPDLGDVLDQLEADHLVVSDLLDRVEQVAGRLDTESDAQRRARAELVGALHALATRLLQHLDVEEDALAPVLSTWTHWPRA